MEKFIYVLLVLFFIVLETKVYFHIKHLMGLQFKGVADMFNIFNANAFIAHALTLVPIISGRSKAKNTANVLLGTGYAILLSIILIGISISS